MKEYLPKVHKKNFWKGDKRVLQSETNRTYSVTPEVVNIIAAESEIRVEGVSPKVEPLLVDRVLVEADTMVDASHEVNRRSAFLLVSHNEEGLTVDGRYDEGMSFYDLWHNYSEHDADVIAFPVETSSVDTSDVDEGGGGAVILEFGKAKDEGDIPGIPYKSDREIVLLMPQGPTPSQYYLETFIENVTLRGIKGDMNILTNGGNITVYDSSGNLDVRTQSGNVKIFNFEGETQIIALDGDTYAEGLTLVGSHNTFTTFSGNIEVGLAEPTNMQLASKKVPELADTMIVTQQLEPAIDTESLHVVTGKIGEPEETSLLTMSSTKGQVIVRDNQ